MKLPKDSVDRVVGDFADAEVGDPRRRRRVQRVVAKLARTPSAPLPAAMGNDAEAQAAYRLLSNRRVAFAALTAAHAEATRQRAEESGNVLVVHDTTDCCFPSAGHAEVGYLQTGKPGFRLHLSLVLDAAGWRRPLGTVNVEPVFRAKRSRRGVGKRKASGIETARWDGREFGRWWRGMARSAETLKACGRVIHVADREGDSYELMANLLATRQRFDIRVRVDRRGLEAGAEGDWSTVRQVAGRCEGMLERDVPLCARKREGDAPGMNKAHPPRKMRIARLRFSATRVVIPRPQYLREPTPKVLELNLVHVSEPAPPSGQPAVEWLLYTTEPIETADQVAGVVDTYRARWTIEEMNAALKTGCGYEKRKFKSRHALLTMLALSLPIACEALALRSRARTDPTAPATDVLPWQQLRILRELGPRKLSAKPTVEEALLAVAAIGGHQRSNGPPGWKVLQRGMGMLIAYEAGWSAALRSTRGADL